PEGGFGRRDVGAGRRDLVVELGHEWSWLWAHGFEGLVGGALGPGRVVEPDEPDVEGGHEEPLGDEVLPGERGRRRDVGDGGAGGEADDELARNAGLGALGEGGGDGEEEEGGDQAAADADGKGHDVQGAGGVVGREARIEKTLRVRPPAGEGKRAG